MNTSANQFNLTTARTCAAWSALAYRTGPTIGTSGPNTGPASQNIRTVLTAPETDTRVLVVEQDDGSIIIAFRGTADIRNWLTDADCVRATLVESAEFGVCKVHAGFLAAYESIISPLTAHLRKNAALCRDAATPLHVTGHSLGGALALLAALELKRQGFNVAQVYTFGQPRVGNAAFKRLYEKALGDRTFRVVYEEDIVPRVPLLPAWHDPYRHVTGEIFVTAFGDLETNPSLTQLLVSDAWGFYRSFCVRQAEPAPHWWPLTATVDPLLDHHINNYLQTLANAALN